MTGQAIKDKVIVALDLPTRKAAMKVAKALGDDATFYKIGLEAVVAGYGIALGKDLKAAGKKVFLDLKLLDIHNTMERAVARAAEHGFDLVTIHASDRQTLKAAVRGAAGSSTALLAVTVMTSVEEARRDLEQQGIVGKTIADMVLHRAHMMHEANGHGVVASARQAAAIRAAIPTASFGIVTPGMRLPDSPPDDQAQTAAPHEAFANGATHIVVGRPVTRHPDGPAEGLRLVHDNIENGR